ncbi:hypothetical protein B484DRAFT_232899 [Ochromonadaceae sp. CCMP2298]|nr:hypothetical protein B484DRAFT_232899 [Ochromonadaceae sp. CCMP2298]|mmetsp:Transcript_13388/g.29597  ORF Transcript_13388/g.29597 Transcript_13388/m.29597 type:complete len:315 (-) Transcript_13388:377-1321(-)|eukprot:CAMPEP_0173246324 /NCGR_PEP_ID=MMETSP1142-20121109/17254_1 /TAXON_ID=483371 /ORGANISM="non described non described, Strain CCMP2298" /LENGTH=314 /DNA_ID=CAMNT_0014178535 /DNA_START=71 /DNA_END=1015 /DNA_ORIENTATION=+
MTSTTRSSTRSGRAYSTSPPPKREKVACIQPETVEETKPSRLVLRRNNADTFVYTIDEDPDHPEQTAASEEAFPFTSDPFDYDCEYSLPCRPSDVEDDLLGLSQASALVHDGRDGHAQGGYAQGGHAQGGHAQGGHSSRDKGPETALPTGDSVGFTSPVSVGRGGAGAAQSKSRLQFCDTISPVPHHLPRGPEAPPSSAASTATAPAASVPIVPTASVKAQGTETATLSTKPLHPLVPRNSYGGILECLPPKSLMPVQTDSAADALLPEYPQVLRYCVYSEQQLQQMEDNRQAAILIAKQKQKQRGRSSADIAD